MFPNKSSVAYSVFLNVTGPKCAWNHLILVVSHPVFVVVVVVVYSGMHARQTGVRFSLPPTER